VTSALLFLVALQGVSPPPSTPAPADEDEAPQYGDQGSSHLALDLGLGGGSNGIRWLGGVEYGYFVLGGVAPGVETQVSGGTGALTTGLLLGTLRLIPVRTAAVSIFVTGRAGRMIIASHSDGWAAGGGGGLIFFAGGRVGFEVAYEVLRLLPQTSCADLSSGCTSQGPRVGLVAGF
jgi:hypothetical protein